MRPDFHIIVIGGGIVGACTAALAAATPEFAGLRIALVEERPPVAPTDDDELELRVSAISRASQRILTTFGAWSALAPAHLSAYEEMVVWDAAGKPRGPASIQFSASASGEPNLGHIVENRRLQWAIYDSATFHDRVTLLQGALSAIEFSPEAAHIGLADGRRYSAALVVGSDGADSVCRKLADIQTEDHDYEQAAFVTHVRTEYPHRRTAWQRFLPRGPLAFLPLNDGRSSIVWTTTPDHARELVEDSPPQVETQLRAAIDGAFGEIKVAAARASFPLRRMHASRYCMERLVLVGDAAHTVHPLAGQGVNLGLLDSAALIETLASEVAASGTVEAIGEKHVLRRYERWRKSENALALELIDGLNRLFSNPQPAVSSLRGWGLNLIDRTPLAKRWLMSRAMGTGGELPKVAQRARHPG